MDRVEAPSMSVKVLKGSWNKRHNYYVLLKAWKMCKSAGFIWLFDQYLHKRSTFLLHISASQGAAILHVSLGTNEEQKRDGSLHIRPCSWRYTHTDCWHKMAAPKVMFSRLSNCRILTNGTRNRVEKRLLSLKKIVFHTYWWWLSAKHQVTYQVTYWWELYSIPIDGDWA